jgi:DNA polymerase-3 subunit delta
MNYTELIRNIEKGIVSPIYLFYGDEGFLIDEAVKRIVSSIIEPSNRDFNLEILRGGETGGEEIVSKAQTLPFMGERRVVIVKGIDDLKASGAERLVEYCSNPSPTTALILTGHKIDGRGKLYNAISKNGVVIQFKPLYEKDTAGWVMRFAKDSGYRIDNDARDYLLSLVGNSLQRLKNELEKVFTYKGDNKDIKIDDIRLLVEDTKIETIFAFTDSIGSKNINKAIKLLDKMFSQGEMPEKIIGMITRQFRLILLTKVCRERGAPSSEIPAKAGFAPFLLEGYLKQAAKYTLRELQDSFYKVQKADIKIKSSDASKKIVIEKLIFDLCSSGLYPDRIDQPV